MSWCREAGILTPVAEAVLMGAVLAMDDDGNYAPFSGEAPAVAVLISKDLPASAEPQPCTVLRRGACVAAPNLAWLSDVTDEQKNIALKQLTDLGIVPLVR